MPLHKDVEEVVYSPEQIQAIVEKLGKQITEDYAGKNLVLVGVLTGSVVFLADLMRHIELPCKIDFIQASSYGCGTESSGKVTISKDLPADLSGMDILLVEDIVDTGICMAGLMELLKNRHPNSLRLCAMLNKPSRRRMEIEPDYVGAEVDDVFIVGYGLDYAQRYRNLPYIGVLKPEVYSA